MSSVWLCNTVGKIPTVCFLPVEFQGGVKNQAQLAVFLVLIPLDLQSCLVSVVFTCKNWEAVGT